MQTELRAVLAADAGVSDLVPLSRINWGAHPQGSPLPCIVLRQVSAVDGAHMQGPNGMPQGRVQADCYAATAREADAVARAVRRRLHFYRGGMFLGIFHAATRDGREGGSNEADRPFLVGLDFTLTWRDDNG